MVESLVAIVGALIGAFVAHWLTVSREEHHAPGKLRAVQNDEVLSWGWNHKTLLTHLISFDRRLVGETLTAEREGTVDQWSPIFKRHPETWALLVRGTREIVGYWHFAPLKRQEFERAKRGELLDSEITLDTIEPMVFPGRYNLYVVFIGGLDHHEQVRVTRMFLRRLEHLARRGIFFQELCANAFTESGRRACEAYGMKPIRRHHDFGEMYLGNLIPWPEELRSSRELKELYEEEERRAAVG